MQRVWPIGAILAVAALGAACTVHQADVPPLTGPSEYGLSIDVTATPDTIRHDGVDRSMILVRARDASGGGVSGMGFRLDIITEDGPAEFGFLSSRWVVTAADGSAEASYTAPDAPPANAPLGQCVAGSTQLIGRCVWITATPISSSFGRMSPQAARIHLVPPAVIVPIADPSAPSASFVFAPSSPSVNEVVVFDASASQALPGRTIVRYTWTWGDGTGATRSVPTEDHDYTAPGIYPVTLTVVDDAGGQGVANTLIVVR